MKTNKMKKCKLILKSAVLLLAVAMAVPAASADDNNEELKALIKKAKSGDSQAQIELADFYWEENPEEGFKWAKLSAEQGNPYAQQTIGQSYLYGDGVEYNFEEAAKWLEKAARHFVDTDLRDLKICYKVLKRLESSQKDEGDMLMDICNQLRRGKEMEFIIASDLLRKAAEKGNAEAQYKLGYEILLVGYFSFAPIPEDVDAKSLKEGLDWIQKSAAQNNPYALAFLGWYCHYEKNYVEAIKWLNKALEQEPTCRGDEVASLRYAPAICLLGECYENGTGVLKNPVVAVELYEKAANYGYDCADAQYRLGRCYEEGIGVEKCIVSAAEWYTKAAENNSTDAQEALVNLKQKYSGLE